MGRPRHLTAAFVQTVTAPGRYGDGRGGFGLSLLVKPTTNGRVSRTWAQRLRIEGVPCDFGLGSFPKVTLGEARKRALANARIAEDGKDPRRKPAAVLTFAKAAEETINVLRPGWKPGSKTESQTRFLLARYILPQLGRKLVPSMVPADVIAVVTPIALEKPGTGRKVKALIAQVFKWAIAAGHITHNPADSNINAALPKLTGKQHHAALPFAEVAGAIKTIRQSGAWLGTKLLLEFTILTACRSGEGRLADWSEIDLEAGLWTIPGRRMKSGRPHVVPLSPRALEILAEAMPLSGGTGLIFPSAQNKAPSDNTLSKLLRENGIKCVIHGFRSSFRDWCAHANVDRQVAESALAHAVGDATESAYLRSDLLALRRSAMTAWSKYLLEQLPSFSKS